jgi:hypothetical protein
LHLGWSQFAIEEYKVHAATQGKSVPGTIFFRVRSGGKMPALFSLQMLMPAFPPTAGLLLIFAASSAPC